MEEIQVERDPEPDPTPAYRAVATLVGVVAAVGLFLALRPAPPVIARPATSAGISTTPVATTLVVHVAGAVRTPGIYELPAGTRVADAIDAAGGPRPRADLSLLNLAEPLQDGIQILVSTRGGAAATGAPAAAATPGPALIDLNSADAIALEAVPGIGPVKAAAIISFRDEIGTFSSLDQLLEVTGIGPATLESIRPYVTI